MKKRVVAVLLCGALAMSSLTGCGKLLLKVISTKTDVESVAETESEDETQASVSESAQESDSESEAESEESSQDGNGEESIVSSSDAAESESESASMNSGSGLSEEACKEAYFAFLNGEKKAKTGDFYKTDEEYYYGLAYGTYDFNELKKAVAEIECVASQPYYSFIDFGKDGELEMVLRLQSLDGSFMNWVGVFKYDGQDLYLNYDYQDGYRTDSILYDSGYLSIGGSGGAGAHYHDLVGFNADGVGDVIFSDNYFMSSFAMYAKYDVNPEGFEFENDYEMLYDSEMELATFVKKGEKTRFAAASLSDDEETRSLEEKLIEEYEKNGAEYISFDELNQLCSLSAYESAEVEWMKWEMALEESSGVNFDVSSVEESSLDYEEIVAEYEADVPNEYRCNLCIKPNENIKKVSVVALSWEDMDQDGNPIYSVESEYFLDELPAGAVLLVRMVFWGDMPTKGIVYEDANGTQHLKTIGMSGFDGSITLDDALIK